MKTTAIFLLLACSLIAGCIEESFEDVSYSDKFKGEVGSMYEIVGAVDAYGIRDYSIAEVKYVTLIPRPGIDGPEVAFRLPLEIGSKITVLQVVKSNRWFDYEITYIVKMENGKLPSGKKIRIDLFRGNKGRGQVGLSEDFYRKIE